MTALLIIACGLFWESFLLRCQQDISIPCGYSSSELLDEASSCRFCHALFSNPILSADSSKSA